jgi:hypothetical protein
MAPNMNDQSFPSTSTLSHDDPSPSDKMDQTKPESELTVPDSSQPPNPSTATLPLLRGRMSLAEALDEEDDVLLPLKYSSQREDFFLWIYKHREDFNELVSLHLGLSSSESCRFGVFKEWKHGSFNVCIPIYIDSWKTRLEKRVLLRIPLPYKVGESRCPGNADEKLRAEAATFIWIKDNCSNIPVPLLWGFGFPNGQSVQTPF